MYDAIVVGARCAGSPTAMLLAQQGHRVLVVDKDIFPSDTLSTHYLHQSGVARLAHWGLLDALRATGCPPMKTFSLDFGPFAVAGPPHPAGEITDAYGPRRKVLDQILLDAALEAGAEFREGFTVEDIVINDGAVTGIRGRSRAAATTVTEQARIVIGADGLHSRVAKAVDPPRYHETPTLTCVYYSYWSGVPTDGFEVFIRDHRAMGAIATHDGLTLVLVGAPRSEFSAFRHDIDGFFSDSLEQAPSIAERVRAGTREERFVGTADLPNFLRKPYGPGWALVGDAGCHKDPCTAQGIGDAFRDADLLAAALHDGLSGDQPMDDALAAYQKARDDALLPLLEFTCQLATLEPPPPQMQQLLGAVHTNAEATSQFLGVLAGTVRFSDFFDPQNVGAVLAGASSE